MKVENAQNILVFNTNNELELQVKLENETVWLTQAQMCLLFDKDKSTISRHISNIFKESELTQNSVVANFATTATDGKTYQVDYYNLDVIISVGYRVKSQQGTQFRIWATQHLKDYLLKGYTINEQRLAENKQQFLTAINDLKLLTQDKERVQKEDILTLVQSFANTWFTLDRFDKAEFPEQGIERVYESNSDELYQDLEIFKNELINKNEATQLFAQEKNKGSLAGILGNVFQSVFGQDAYPTVEEKAAHLLYFIVKNHPFNDGNKRSGAFAFIWLLNKFNIDFMHKINPQALAALTLVIAESNPTDKDKMIGLVKLLLK